MTAHSHIMGLGQCRNFLRSRGILVAERGGNVRVSVNIFNDEEDIERLCEGISECCGAPA